MARKCKDLKCYGKLINKATGTVKDMSVMEPDGTYTDLLSEEERAKWQESLRIRIGHFLADIETSDPDCILNDYAAITFH